ncbi:MAG: hypothetical protein QOF78_1995, partial [Phycisphaerales bacterium]|nr:hypothetical protein [Phycisphaerales bacterium]
MTDTNETSSSSGGKVIFLVDSSRATFAELWRDASPATVGIAWLLKILRQRLPGSVNDPNVESLAPFEIAEAALAPEVRAAMEPALREMFVLGFDLVAVHEIIDLFNQSRSRIATLARGDGSAIGRVWYRTEGGGNPPKTHFYCDFLTAFGDGSFVWSTAARSVLESPPQMHVTRQTGASAETLWQHHVENVQRRGMTSGAQPIAAAGREPVLDVIEKHHALLRDFHLARKLFRPMRPGEQQRASEIESHVGEATAAGMAYPEVWAELVRMQKRRTGWGAAALLLVVSLMLFIGIGAGAAKWEWEFIVLIVGLLAFHELGHFLAMKIFRYRNVRMFFIPMLGAAVSGVNYSAPGWKKVVVALMGPLPGIFLGAVAGTAGAYLQNEMLLKIGVYALVLNGLNLLPVLPLDGGRVMHTLFFSRHWALDVIFRVGAAIVLIGGGFAIGDRILMLLGIFTLLGIPAAYRLARIASELRREGIRRAAPEEQMIPPDVAQQIITKVRGAFPRALANRTAAMHTLNVYETINTRTPGWLATTAFTFVHFGAVLFVVLAGVLFAVAQHGGIGPMVDMARTRARAQRHVPKYALAVEQIQIVDGEPSDAAPTTAPSSIVATFATPDEARITFDELRTRRTSIALFGQSIMLPVADPATREQWFDELEKRSGGGRGGGAVFVASAVTPSAMALDCVAPDANTAKEVAAEVREYFSVPMQLHLIPPWSPAYDKNRRDAWRRARQTFVKIHSGSADVFDNAEMRELSTRMNTLRRRGDTEGLKKLQDEHEKLYEKLRRAHRRRLLDSLD